MPPIPPSALANKIFEMIKRRRPDLNAVVEELSRSREGRSVIAEAFGIAYETYVKTARLDDAFEAFVEAVGLPLSADTEPPIAAKAAKNGIR